MLPVLVGVCAEPQGFGRLVPVPGSAAAVAAEAAAALQPAADPAPGAKGSVLSSVAAFYRANHPVPAEFTPPDPWAQPGVRAPDPTPAPDQRFDTPETPANKVAEPAELPPGDLPPSKEPLPGEPTPDRAQKYGPTSLASLPKAIILGAGKCGTNALAEALRKLGLEEAHDGWAVKQEEERQGFAGEVNWPCAQWEGDGLEKYKQHFPQPSPKHHFDYFDKSTMLMGCAWNITHFVPPEVKLFAVLCDPLEAVWSRMNFDRASFGANATNATVLINTVRTRLNNRGPPGVGKDCLQLHALDPLFSLPLCYQLDSSLHYAWWAKSWGSAIESGRVKFLLAERSLQNPMYFVREAAAHLGIGIPKGSKDLGVVHSTSDDPTHLAPQGEQWNQFIALGAPKIRPIAQELHDAIPDLFGNKSVDMWWPWAKFPAGYSKALPSLPVHQVSKLSRARATCKSWCGNGEQGKADERASPTVKVARDVAQGKLCENPDCGSCDFCQARQVSGGDESKPKPKAASEPKAASKREAAVKEKVTEKAAAKEEAHVASEPEPKAPKALDRCKSINSMVDDAWCDTGCRAAHGSHTAQAPGCDTMCCCEDSCVHLVPMACKAGEPGCGASLGHDNVP